MVTLLAFILMAAPPRSVELTVAPTRIALEGPLLVRLTQEGFIVYPKGQPAAVKIRIADDGTQLRIEVEGAGDLQTATVVPHEDATLAELQLEVTQKAIALASAVRVDTPPAPVEVKAQPAPAAAPSAPITWELRLDVGVLAGDYIATPVLVQAGVRAGRSGAVHLIAGLFPTSGDATGDTPGFLVEAGVGYRFKPVWRLEIEPVLVVGVARFNPSFVAAMATPGLFAGVNLADSIHLGLRSLFGIKLFDFVFGGPHYCFDLGLFFSYRFW